MGTRSCRRAYCRHRVHAKPAIAKAEEERRLGPRAGRGRDLNNTGGPSDGAATHALEANRRRCLVVRAADLVAEKDEAAQIDVPDAQ